MNKLQVGRITFLLSALSVLTACTSSSYSSSSSDTGLDFSLAFIQCNDRYVLPNPCFDYAKETNGRISFYQWLKNTGQTALADYVRNFEKPQKSSQATNLEKATTKRETKKTASVDKNKPASSSAVQPVQIPESYEIEEGVLNNEKGVTSPEHKQYEFIFPTGD